MARMYPRELPAWVQDDPLRSAERRVYETLRVQLGDQFNVYYSRPWLGTTPDGREIDGEADFVIAHPEKGILILEVKGGAIRRDAEREIWTSKDRYGITHLIKNPVEQARKSKYEIIRKLKLVPFWESRYVRVKYGVVLPDSARPAGDLGAEMPLMLFAFAEDIDDLSGWVQTRLGGEEAIGLYQALGMEGLKALNHILARSFELHMPLNSSMEIEEHDILVLTEQQYNVLEFLKRMSRTVIEGGAGSGKTLLAMESARRMSAEGIRTLLTCYSHPLAEHLRQFAGESECLTVKSFNNLCGAMAREAGLISGERVDDHKMPYQAAAELLVAAVAENPSLRFEAIIVDEGQDFRREWMDALELCLASTRASRFHVFLDNNQRVYDPYARAPVDLSIPPFPLTRNLRNSRQIFELTRLFYAGPVYSGSGPSGQKVRFIRTSASQRTLAVVQQLGVLTKSEGIRPEHIAVLASDRSQVSSALTKAVERHYNVTDALHCTCDSVLLDTVTEFKGLERRVVILLASDRLLDDPELAYVGFSRARLLLIVMGEDETLRALQRMTVMESTGIAD